MGVQSDAVFLRNKSSHECRGISLRIAQALDRHGVFSSLDDIHTEDFVRRLIVIIVGSGTHQVGTHKVVDGLRLKFVCVRVEPYGNIRIDHIAVLVFCLHNELILSAFSSILIVEFESGFAVRLRNILFGERRAEFAVDEFKVVFLKIVVENIFVHHHHPDRRDIFGLELPFESCVRVSI